MKTRNLKTAIFLVLFLVTGSVTFAQIVTKRAVDNKGTINTVLDATTTVITSAGNGLTVDNSTATNPRVELGGTLTKPTTTIGTSASNLLQVTGLQAGATTDEIVTIIPGTGQLRRLSASTASGTADNGLTKTGNNTRLGGALVTPTTITADATNTLTLAGLQAGATTDDVVTLDAAGVLRRTTRAATDATTASNGLNLVGSDVRMGGALTAATTITTTGTNTLAVAGLTAGDLATDNIVVSSTGGVLKSVAASSLLQSGTTNVPSATAAQTTITVANMPANASRVWVYRNGVKLISGVDYTTAAGTVTLVPTVSGPNAWAVAAGDNLEVQWVK
jgi:hypothetical protein